MHRLIRRLMALLRFGRQPPGDRRDLYAWRPVPPGPPPPGDRRDPFAWRPVPRRPQPHPRSSAAAVAEPDE